MEPYQQRVVEERKELDGRREKLATFINGATFNSLPVEERNRLYRQSQLMHALSAVLGERIEAFSHG